MIPNPCRPRTNLRLAPVLTLAFGLASSAPAAAATPATEPLPPVDPAALDAFLDEHVPPAMEEADVPGLAFAFVQASPGGEASSAEGAEGAGGIDPPAPLVHLRGWGLADASSGAPVDPGRTVFRVGSIAKPVTATTVLSTLEDLPGLGLQDDLRPLLAELPIRPPLTEPLTLRQLLTQTGGFDETLFGQHAATAEAWSPLDRYLRENLPPRFAPPGEVIAYCDFHTSLAGYALARAAGTPFERLAEERVLGPLGMDRTTFRQVDLPAPVEEALAAGHHRTDGELAAYPRDFVQTTPAAGLQASAGDLARYLAALLAPESEPARRVMAPAAWRAQRARQFGHHPELPGKGFGLTQVRRGRRDLWYKDGQASGFHARLVIAPDLGIAWFSVHNRSIIDPLGAFNAAARVHRDLGWALLDHLAPSEGETGEPTPPEPAPGAAERIPRYVGTFRTTVASRHTLEKLLAMLDEIRVEPDGPGRLRLAGGRYVEVEPGLLQWHEGHKFYAAFRLPAEDADRLPASHLFFGAGAYERIPWWETSRTAGSVLAGCTLVFLVALVTLGRPVLGRGPAGRGRARRLASAAWAVALLDLLFLVGLGASLATTDPQTLFHGWPWSVRAALALPVAALVPLAWLGYGVPTAWTRRHGSKTARTTATLVVAAGLVFAAWLHLWNALGWRL